MKISFLKIAGAFSLVLFWLIGSWQSAGAVNVQSYEGLVNDYAQVLSDEVENSLETRLQDEASKENGAELAVVTLPSLDGEEIESVALAYFDTWKIGKAKQDNGVLLLIAISDREIRIQTGYGVEPIIPDGVAGRIIRNDIVPYLKEEQYDQAVIVGVDRILALIADPSVAREYQSASLGSLMTVLLMAAFFGFIGLIVWLSIKYSPKLGSISSGTKSSWSKPSSFSSSSHSSSSSSFSFGGGRSGGGGASGKW